MSATGSGEAPAPSPVAATQPDATAFRQPHEGPIELLDGIVRQELKSARWESNPLHPHWRRGALPVSYGRETQQPRTGLCGAGSLLRAGDGQLPRAGVPAAGTSSALEGRVHVGDRGGGSRTHCLRIIKARCSASCASPRWLVGMVAVGFRLQATGRGNGSLRWLEIGRGGGD